MFKMMLAGVVLAGCAGAPSAPPVHAACPAGEVTVWEGEPVTCDLVGGTNTLTILGGTEAECNDAGGRWWYEACVEVDF